MNFMGIRIPGRMDVDGMFLAERLRRVLHDAGYKALTLRRIHAERKKRILPVCGKQLETIYLFLLRYSR